MMCDKYNQFWKLNLKQEIETDDGHMINFIRCSNRGNDGVFNYIILEPGLKLYHGSPPIGKLIKKNVDPIFPLGVPSNMEETWYSSYDVARRYAERDEVLVYKVIKPAKMLIINQIDNLKKLVNAKVFPDKLTSEQERLKKDFDNWLHKAIWIQTGQAGKLYTFCEHGMNEFTPTNYNPRDFAIERYGKRWIEHEFAAFLCNWLKKLGYAGYISDRVYTRNKKMGGPGLFHVEAVFCYAPDYLIRLSNDELDARYINPNLNLINKKFEATPFDYIKFYHEIKDNPKIDPKLKEKWRLAVQAMKMPISTLDSRGYQQLCQLEHGYVDIYKYATDPYVQKHVQKFSTNFPTKQEIETMVKRTDDVIGFFNYLCKELQKYPIISAKMAYINYPEEEIQYVMRQIMTYPIDEIKRLMEYYSIYSMRNLYYEIAKKIVSRNYK